MFIVSLFAILGKKLGSEKVSGFCGVPSYLRDGFTKNEGALSQHFWFNLEWASIRDFSALPLFLGCGSVALQSQDLMEFLHVMPEQQPPSQG